MRRRLALSLLPILLGGCATGGVGRSRPAEGAEAPIRTGRLALQVTGDSARSFSAGFELEGSASQGRLTLLSPLGLPLGQAQWRPGEVQLDSGTSSQRYDDLETMMQALTGDALPLAALFDWIEGSPWPGDSSRPLTASEGTGFRQLGWSVRTDRLADGLLVAERRLPEPAVTLRLKLDPRP